MANKKITALTETMTLSESDMLPVVVDIPTTPTTKKISTSSLRKALVAPNPNLLTNGNFIIGQRATLDTAVAVPSGSAVFNADRWKAYRDNLVAGSAITRNATNLEPDGMGNQLYFCRTVGDTSLQNLVLIQDLETADSIPLRGKYLTFTTRIDKSSNFLGTLTIQILGSTSSTPDLSAMNGFGGTVTTLASYATSSPNGVQTVTTTSPVASNINQIAVKIYYTPTRATAASDEAFWIHGAKLEVGQVFTGWSFPNYTETLTRCLRYYEKTAPMNLAPNAGALDPGSLVGIGVSTTRILIPAGRAYRVEKRTDPTVSLYAYDGTKGVSAIDNTSTLTSNVTASRTGTKGFLNIDATSGTPFTVGSWYWFGWSADAEL